ncbi:TIGR02099 family protein [Curvibacter sp. CHRR-16]|uniref:YhdP family protein n=1 Tax=Curvibacter sp. CHRR-16 TaxID=2835872 RepID=UPI001BDAE9F1|nr:YhdP family protein [Curvibacter sp. CHRR-16]MBT0570428.1 TIGR02099 family protein [Curvibacter sp. CHRR-16]
MNFLSLFASAARLRLWCSFTTWLLRLLLLFWLLVAAVGVALHFWIVPRLQDWRPWLEEKATTSLGIGVHIGRIEALSNGIIPSVGFFDVRLQDAQGRDALVLPSVQVALSPRSLLRGGIEQLHIENPQAELRRAPDGSLWLGSWHLGQSQSDPQAVLDWVFAQPELAVLGGRLVWHDEQRQAPPLVFSQVQVVVRNGLRSHQLRLDATPEVPWASALQLMGNFRRPLWAVHAGRWQEWNGQLYAALDRLDAAALEPYIDTGVTRTRGVGGMRGWLDWQDGQVHAITADVSLHDIDVQAEQGLPSLQVRTASGRLGVLRLDGGLELFSQGLQFETTDGLHWPGGNVRLRHWQAQAAAPGRSQQVAHGEAHVEALDLRTLRELAERLPLPAKVHEALQALAPSGRVNNLQAQWQGDVTQGIAHLSQYHVQGDVQQFALMAGHGNSVWPGVKGLNAHVQLDEQGGQASLSMGRGGVVDIPWLAEPAIGVDELKAQLSWHRNNGRWQVKVQDMTVANADARGTLQATWDAPPAGQSGLGKLDLRAHLSQALVSSVYRYLPTALDASVRDYLRAALLGGSSNQADFVVVGDLDRFPFRKAEDGEFHITAKGQGVVFAFAPDLILPKGSLPWPVLSQLQGSFELNRDQIHVQVERGRVRDVDVSIGRSEAHLTDLFNHAQLSVAADAEGDLTQTIAALNHSPILGLTDHALEQAHVTGRGFYKLKLAFPLDKVEQATVNGTVLLAGNDIALGMDIPPLQQVRGVVRYTEQGFGVNGITAQAAGGPLRVEGGLQFSGPATSGAQLRLQGIATAEGLRQLPELGPVASLARLASGQTSYNATVAWREGQPEIRVQTDLQGLGVDAPAPLGKRPEQSRQVAVERTVLLPAARQDRWQVRLGSLGTAPAGAVAAGGVNAPEVSAVYVRDLGSSPAKVLRGAVNVGVSAADAVALPDAGVAAAVRMEALDVGAWQAVLDRMDGTAATNKAGASVAGPVAVPESIAYWPTQMNVRVDDVAFSGRHWKQMAVRGTRAGLEWRVNVESSQFNGYVEYRLPGGVGHQEGRLYARLARMSVPQGGDQAVEQVLDQQPASIPSLDIVVQDFELGGKRLGKLELEALNQGSGASREWRLTRFNVQNPDATFTASGSWAVVPGASSNLSVQQRRRTHLDFKLDVLDAGELLTRFGMPGVVRSGEGRLEGQISWLGSALAPHYPSMAGNVHVQVEKGQFLKADPGVAKLLGVLSLQSLPRRLLLDFRDVFSQGFAFDFVRGDVDVDQGIAKTNNLQMKGVAAGVFMDGQADIAKETQNLRVVVVPEINAGSASLLWSTVNPIAGLSTFIAQLFLRGPMVNAATQEFTIDGSWTEPRITPVEHK